MMYGAQSLDLKINLSYVQNGFSKFLNHVYRLKKDLYRLKQTSRAWYERLTTYLLEKKFEKARVDRTLFINRSKDELLVAQIYVDGLVFEATSSDLALSLAKEMKTKFEMSMVGELTFFLRFQLRQLKNDPSMLGNQLRNSIQNLPNTLKHL